MSDIVERLRDEAETELEWTTTYKIMTEAADEIDRLRKENAELKGALRADAERLQTAGDRVDLATGCDTADAMADEIDRLRLAISIAHAEGMEEAARIVQKALSEESDIPPRAVPYITGIMAAIRRAKESKG